MNIDLLVGLVAHSDSEDVKVVSVRKEGFDSLPVAIVSVPFIGEEEARSYMGSLGEDAVHRVVVRWNELWRDFINGYRDTDIYGRDKNFYQEQAKEFFGSGDKFSLGFSFKEVR